MLSRKLYFVFTMGAIIVALLVVFVLPDSYEGQKTALWMVPFVVLLSLSYVFSPQIDWWWYQKNPPELAPGLSNMLMQHFTFYKNLSGDNKRRLRNFKVFVPNLSPPPCWVSVVDAALVISENFMVETIFCEMKT